MTGHKDILSSFQETKGDDISFGDRSTGGIIGQGSIELNSKIKVCVVHLVKNLGFNLLSVAQLCDEGPNTVEFTTSQCFVRNLEREVILKGRRANSTYLFDRSYLPRNPLCLAAIKDFSNLCHQR